MYETSGQAAVLRWALALAVALGGAACRRDRTETPAWPPRADIRARAKASDDPRIELVELRSDRLSRFAGKDVLLRAAIVTPRDYDPDRGYPSFYYVHGFGGSADKSAARLGREIAARMKETGEPDLVYVLLDASHPQGHHVFADSANIGPWGTALVDELVPAIDARYGTVATAQGRFVGGHSSGGWSSLWLQIQHPDVFGGVWSTSPDPVDFRDFVGVDIYSFENVYRTPAGATVQLVWDHGAPKQSLKDFVADEQRTRPVGGQFGSFDAVFSPRGADGAPRPLFDRKTGVIDHAVAEAWRAYDISSQLRTHWARYAGPLDGKLHVIVGTDDTFGLDRPVKRLSEDLAPLAGDAQSRPSGPWAEFLFVEGRDHFDLYDPHPEYYPEGLRHRIEEEALAQFAKP